MIQWERLPDQRSTKGLSPARAAVFEVLIEVTKGAFASDALLERSRELTSRDAGLASQIVFGCLRFQSQLDFLISQYSGRQTTALDIEVLIALRAAVFQLRYLDRVSPHAAVHESVEYVKRRKRSATGFANAVLRKVNRSPVSWPNRSIKLACPEWLLDRWGDHFGADVADGIAEAALHQPYAYIRLSDAAAPVELDLEPTDVPGCFRLLSPLPPGMRSHDIGAQSIVPLLDLRPGDSYLDLCAAPGNKMVQALEVPLSLAVAGDRSEKRLRTIPPICNRVVLDGTQPLPFGRKFNRILIDAPCSGTGTLGRNPEIKWRVTATDFARFRSRQIALVNCALPLLTPGGRLVYATCSLEREENEDVVTAVVEGNRQFEVLGEHWRIPGRNEGDGFYAAVLCRCPEA